FPVAAQLEQQLTDVRAWADQHQKHGFYRQHGHDGQSVSVLQHGREQLATSRSGAKVVCWTDDGGNSSGDVLCGQARPGMAVDEEAVTTEDDGGVHALSLPDGGDQITNARHIPRFNAPAKWWRS